ncbi:MAG: hypothetical protein WC768_04660 [Patescibacteria group bacterium]|jgi:hypothetical protein
MKNFKKIKLTLITGLIFVSLLIAPLTMAASIFDQASTGLKDVGDAAYGSTNKVDETLFAGGLISIINSLLTFIGFLFFLLLIYAGFLWMNAHGREEQVEKAKKITREAVIGLIIVILARVFTELVLTQIGTAITAK